MSVIMKYLSVFVILTVTILTCSQSIPLKEPAVFRIDPSIKAEIDKHITEFEDFSGGEFLIYQTTLLADYYEYDTLLTSTKPEGRPFPFRSFFYKNDDTLSIDGAYGMFGGFGFSIQFIGDQPVVYHLAAGDESPAHSFTEDGELQFRLLVPCTNAELTLSRMPKAGELETRYGRVAFESRSYYESAGFSNGKEIRPRRKVSMDMEIFFKADYLIIPD